MIISLLALTGLAIGYSIEKACPEEYKLYKKGFIQSLYAFFILLIGFVGIINIFVALGLLITGWFLKKSPFILLLFGIASGLVMGTQYTLPWHFVLFIFLMIYAFKKDIKNLIYSALAFIVGVLLFLPFFFL